MRHLKLYSALFVLLLIASSCASARKAHKTSQTPPANNMGQDTAATEKTPETKVVPGSDSSETMSSVLEKMNHIDFTTFSGRADVSFSNNGKGMDVNAKINMKKDELVWISVTGPLGIEGARMLVTKDSVQIMDRLHKEYIAESVTYLQDKAGLPLDLHTLQDLLIGNTLFIDKNSSSYTRNSDSIAISSQTRYFRNLLTVLLPGYLPVTSKLDDVDASRNRSAILQYSDYKKADNFNFPETRDITVNYKNQINVKLNFKSYNFNQEISAPFSVPKSYKRKN